MGRKAGHLALGMGKAAGATLTLIPEEFAGRKIKLKAIVDTLVGAILKRLSYGRRDGVAVIAEGVVLPQRGRASRSSPHQLPSQQETCQPAGQIGPQ
jgi:6-phosphofructokinase